MDRRNSEQSVESSETSRTEADGAQSCECPSPCPEECTQKLKENALPVRETLGDKKRATSFNMPPEHEMATVPEDKVTSSNETRKQKVCTF